VAEAGDTAENPMPVANRNRPRVVGGGMGPQPTPNQLTSYSFVY
jgi:hypothetical protein